MALKKEDREFKLKGVKLLFPKLHSDKLSVKGESLANGDRKLFDDNAFVVDAVLTPAQVALIKAECGQATVDKRVKERTDNEGNKEFTIQLNNKTGLEGNAAPYTGYCGKDKPVFLDNKTKRPMTEEDIKTLGTGSIVNIKFVALMCMVGEYKGVHKFWVNQAVVTKVAKGGGAVDEDMFDDEDVVPADAEDMFETTDGDNDDIPFDE